MTDLRFLKLASLFVTIFILGCEKTYHTDGVIAVSLVQLIVDPSMYKGQQVSTKGYLFDFTGNPNLFLSKDHAVMRDVLTAVNIRKPKQSSKLNFEPCLNKYVTVKGTVVERPKLKSVVYIEIKSIYDEVEEKECLSVRDSGDSSPN